MQLILGSGKSRKAILIPSPSFCSSQENKITREKVVEGVKAMILRPATFRGFE